MQTTWGSLLWFVAILAAIPVALWLLKRSPMVGGNLLRPGTPRPVAVTPLGGQNKLVTVEVGQGDDRLWLVLGVTPQSIRTLHTMTPQPPGPARPAGAAPAPTTAFAHLLSRLRQPGAGDDAR